MRGINPLKCTGSEREGRVRGINPLKCTGKWAGRENERDKSL
jgi:hypothetical protein